MGVFLCHREPCCRGFEVPVVLPCHSSLGDYVGGSFGKPKYREKPQWPFLFICNDCSGRDKVKIETLDRFSGPFSQVHQVHLDSLRSQTAPKLLWRVRIASDDPPNAETFYTVAPRFSTKAHFADLATRAFNELRPIHENAATCECFVYDFS